MSRKKKKIFPSPPPVVTNSYFAYYDPATNVLLSISNEKLDNYPAFLEINFDTYEKLVIGKEKFSDYLLGYVKIEDKSIFTMRSKVEEAHSFKSTTLDIISDSNVKDPDLIVEWNLPKNEWNFFASVVAKKSLSPKISGNKLLFFVLLESDYDFLIRTIVVDGDKFLSQVCVGVPFESGLEKQIKKISIATRLMFESHKLRIINE
jgi:hypothetical protein